MKPRKQLGMHADWCVRQAAREDSATERQHLRSVAGTIRVVLSDLDAAERRVEQAEASNRALVEALERCAKESCRFDPQTCCQLEDPLGGPGGKGWCGPCSARTAVEQAKQKVQGGGGA